jgi:hypothetical protein
LHFGAVDDGFVETGAPPAVDLQLLSLHAIPEAAVAALKGVVQNVGESSSDQRLDELTSRQEAAAEGLLQENGMWGCPGMEFRMMMPAHTGTCSISSALAHSILRAKIPCGWTKKKKGNIHQGHFHEWTASVRIQNEGWKEFNRTPSFVIAKDPWSRVISAVAWNHGLNASAAPEEQIMQFRSYLKQHGLNSVSYLRSISAYAYSVPPGSDIEQQVVSYVGRATDMSGSMKKICKLIGIPDEHCVDPNDPVVSQHHVTGGNRVRTVDLFDDELRGRVAERWAKDIERFGLKFGEF